MTAKLSNRQIYPGICHCALRPAVGDTQYVASLSESESNVYDLFHEFYLEPYYTPTVPGLTRGVHDPFLYVYEAVPILSADSSQDDPRRLDWSNVLYKILESYAKKKSTISLLNSYTLNSIKQRNNTMHYKNMRRI